MWLIKLHIAFSVLCALSIFGVSFLFRKEIEENGWAKGDGKERGLLEIVYCPLCGRKLAE